METAAEYLMFFLVFLGGLLVAWGLIVLFMHVADGRKRFRVRKPQQSRWEELRDRQRAWQREDRERWDREYKELLRTCLPEEVHPEPRLLPPDTPSGINIIGYTDDEAAKRWARRYMARNKDTIIVETRA